MGTMAMQSDGKPKITYGGKVVGRALKESGVEAVFGIYGSINLAIEEANRLGVKMYHFRHEQSAGFAADAYARCLRRPGVCFSSSAPGFVNLVSPIAQARGALSPVVLLNGQHGISGDGLDTVQEGYATEVMKPFAKWTRRCLDWNLHSYWVTKALVESVQYPPGPIVLEFPRNSLNVRGPEQQMKYLSQGRPDPSLPQGDPQEVERALQLLLAAERPLLIAGDGVYWSDGMHALREVAEYLQIPVHSRRTARGAVPENHPLAFTGGYRAGLLRDADVICIVGLRSTWLEEWFEPPEWSRQAKYIQVQENAAEIWPALPTEVAIVGSSGQVLAQMLAAAKDQVRTPPKHEAWLAQLADARSRFKLRQAESLERQLRSNDRLMHPEILGARLAEFLDPSATIIFDSFTGTSFFTDKLEAKFAGQILDAGLHQPVGHGIGMCVGAQVARPGKQVVTLIGDGGFGISAMDMET
jgi:acetolactate synthase-1/2/3 large subunit